MYYGHYTIITCCFPFLLLFAAGAFNQAYLAPADMASIGPCQGNSGAILDQDAVSDDGTSAVSFKENVMPASPAAQKSLGAPLALVIAPRPVTRIKLGKSVGLLVVAPQGADRTLEAPLSSMQLAIVAPENFAANTTAGKN